MQADEGIGGLSGTQTAGNRFASKLALIVALACVVRAALIIHVQLHPARFDYPDSHRYLRVARNIAAGKGPVDAPLRVDEPWLYPETGTDPLYPVLLAPAALSHASDSVLMAWGRIANGIFGLGSVLILAALARRLFDDSIALLAALILAIEPILLFFSALVLTEWVYIFLLLAMCYALVRAVIVGNAGWAISAGAAAGLATMAKSTNLFLPLLMLPLCLCLRRRTTRHGHWLWPAMFFLTTYVIVLCPELVRRYRLTGEITLTRSGGGASLLEGLGPWADGSPGMDRIEFPDVPQNATELERDGIYRAAAIDWAKHHPRETLRLAMRKLLRTWSLTMNAGGYERGAYRLISLLSTIPIFAAAIAGAWQLRKSPGLLAILLVPACYFSLIHMVFVGSVRYRLPAMPFVFILAAVGLSRIWLGRHKTGGSGGNP